MPGGTGGDAYGGETVLATALVSGEGDFTGMSNIVSNRPFLEAPGQDCTKMFDENFLGQNFLAYLTLAIGGALVVGTSLALVKPRPDENGNLVKAPLGRSLIQITVGGLATVWALATIVS